MDVFPDNLLIDIIFWLTNGLLNLSYTADSKRYPFHKRPDLLFSPNCCKFENHKAIVLLSTTCKRLRRLLAPTLFEFVSLVRISELDSIIKSPRHLDKLSNQRQYLKLTDPKAFEDQFFNTIGGNGKEEDRGKVQCGQAFHEKSLSMNNFVTHLEATERTLFLTQPSRSLLAFPRLKHLKILDQPAPIPSKRIDCPELISLAIHLESLRQCNLRLTTLQHLERLDLICDLSKIHPRKEEAGSSAGLLDIAEMLSCSSLRQLNLFVTSSDALVLEDFIAFLAIIIDGNSVEKLSIRLSKSREPRLLNWGVQFENSGPKFISVLSGAKLLTDFTLDHSMMKVLHFPPDYEASDTFQEASSMSFNLVVSSLDLPILISKEQAIVSFIVAAMKATHVSFVYGRVQEGSHLSALSVMNGLLEYIIEHHPNSRLTSASLMEAWSHSDDGMIADHYRGIMDELNTGHDTTQKNDTTRQLKHALITASKTSLFNFNSPRFRKPEYYGVHRLSPLDIGPVLRPIKAKDPPADTFTTVEASIRDLEYYCSPEKRLSNIWL